MALLVDTTTFPAEQRVAALDEMLTAGDRPYDVTHNCPAEVIRTRFDAWQLGALRVARSEGIGVGFKRSSRAVAATVQESFDLAVQLTGTGTSLEGTFVGAIQPGALYLTDRSRPSEVVRPGFATAVSVDLPCTELGLSVDKVRLAGQKLQTSPLYDLVQAHMTRLGHAADAVAGTPAATMLGSATIEMIRALLSSAADDYPHRNEAMHDAIYARIVTYIQQHLTDPELSPEQIARANAVSLRQLYNVWSQCEMSLAEWIMAQRLEGARRELGRSKEVSRKVGAIAHGWGFADSTHFSRRFRQAYGMSPREWRQLHRERSNSDETVKADVRSVDIDREQG